MSCGPSPQNGFTVLLFPVNVKLPVTNGAYCAAQSIRGNGGDALDVSVRTLDAYIRCASKLFICWIQSTDQLLASVFATEAGPQDGVNS